MITDQPITTVKDDLLGRAPFARQVASAMLASPPDAGGSFCIGLTGGWGSGKTSVLNMVAETLQTVGGGKHGGAAPIVVSFNPYHYPAAQQLPGELLHTLAAVLRKPEHGERLGKAAKAMEKYAAALSACAPDSHVETVAELRGAPPKKKKRKKQGKGLQERKQKVCKQLEKQNQRIFVLVDDIDRLSSRRIRHALQLVNAVAAFPRMVYLLSFDQEVVAGALSRELNGSGWEYLKKYMQVQFAVPAPESGRIRDILGAYFDAWLSAKPDLNYDPAYFAEISPAIFRCITSIRDVYRFVNTFRYRYEALGDEVNFVDLLAVTALQLHAPQTLPWLMDHKDDLLRGGGLAYQSADAEQKNRIRQEHLRMFAELGDGDDKTLIQLIGHMFPRYGNGLLNVKSEDTDARVVRMRRICCEEFFDLYFTQSTEKLAITQQEILQTVRITDAEALRRYTDGLVQEERRNAYVVHLPHYLRDISEEMLPEFFYEMLWLSRLPESKTPKDRPFQRSFFHECCYCALRILAQMEDDLLEQTLRTAAARADKHTIPCLVTVLQRIAGRNPDAENVNVDADTLQALLDKLLQKVKAVAAESGWIDTQNPVAVLEFWKQAEPATFRAYLQTLLMDDANAALLVSSLVRRFDQGMHMEYQFGDMLGMHAFADDFPRAAAREALLRLRGTDRLRALPEDVLLDCVAFSLMADDQNRVSHADVLEEVPAWLEPQPAPENDDDDDEDDDE